MSLTVYSKKWTRANKDTEAWKALRVKALPSSFTVESPCFPYTWSPGVVTPAGELKIERSSWLPLGMRDGSCTVNGGALHVARSKTAASIYTNTAVAHVIVDPADLILCDEYYSTYRKVTLPQEEYDRIVKEYQKRNSAWRKHPKYWNSIGAMPHHRQKEEEYRQYYAQQMQQMNSRYTAQFYPGMTFALSPEEWKRSVLGGNFHPSFSASPAEWVEWAKYAQACANVPPAAAPTPPPFPKDLRALTATLPDLGAFPKEDSRKTHNPTAQQTTQPTQAAQSLSESTSAPQDAPVSSQPTKR